MNGYLEISDLTKYYRTIRALDEVKLSLERGSVLALLGPNGAGKSTLFSCLLGLTTPTRGNIFLEGQTPANTDRANIGYVAERVSLYPQRTVAENAAFFARLRGQSHSEVKTQLKRVGLSRVGNRRVCQLSKGMLQRLGLAIALCGQPKLLVLDEPFNGLDPALLDALQAILREEHQHGATLLISTHSMSAVEPLATHAAILLSGKLAAFSTLDGLRAQHDGADSLESIYHRIARERQSNQEVLA
jgi:ABC-type multidrug transport system, ATPase component